MAQKVIVGMSGGVDSSVAAFLLKEAGFDVEGLFMKNWEGDDQDNYCAAAIDLHDAQVVCDKLTIPLHTVNFAKKYWDNVFTHFLNEYRKGRTPNPDILCNKEIKFNAFLHHAIDNMEADFIATGHYVKKDAKAGLFRLLKGSDRSKDQSYFLYAITQKALAKSLFPVGHLTKIEVRKIAKEQGLITHDKKDSTGICFIGERKFKHFLQEYLLITPGEIVTTDKKIMGKHDGLMYYTLGQRQGLGVGGAKNSDNSPWYVVDKDIKNNQLIIAQGKNHPFLFANGLICSEINYLSGQTFTTPQQCTAKTRYRQADSDCLLTQIDNHRFCVMFSIPQRAITPGQSIVFYQKNHCLGGAIIEEVIH